MKVLVLGAGIVGVATAYFLNRAGHEVTVVDRQPGAGLETSFANGGQISASHSMPWSSPSAPFLMLKWLGRRDAPLLWRLRADPSQWLWGLRFLANCTPGRSTANMEKNLTLALHSRTLLREIRQEADIHYDERAQGILQIFRNTIQFDAAAKDAERMTQLGCTETVLDRDGCLDLEPALRDTGEAIAGGVHAPDDETGDAHTFTRELARVIAERGVQFRYGVTVIGFDVERAAITRVVTNRGELTADAYVMALGSYSQLLLRPLGVNPHIFPTKGYSVTVPTDGRNGAPTVSITDVDHKIVYSRLGDRLRVAGTAEFAGFDSTLTEERARVILGHAQQQFPNAGDFTKAKFWTGLRPLTPDGVPVLGRTRYMNLYLNTGHGTLGWTLAAGSGQVVADLIGGKAPALDMSRYGVDRF
jgi:D-amino-acid dehydrogenase